jgi:tripeptidyl-peptidase-1
MESRYHVPFEWVELPDEEVSPDELINLSFFLKTPIEKAKKLEEELYHRSDPKSLSYGKWLSNDEVHALSAPHEVSRNLINHFLTHDHNSKVTPRTPNGDIVSTTITIAQAEKMLSTTYKKYQHKSGKIVTRCESYSLPDYIAEHVSLVGPTTHLPKYLRPIISHERKKEDIEVSTNTPDNLRALYGVDDVMGGNASSNKQAVTAFLSQYYSESDLSTFWDDYFPQGSETSINLVGDATTGSPAGVESMLDIEYMPSLGAWINTGFWGFSGESPNDSQDEPFLTWLMEVSSTPDNEVPLVFSTSYGEDEATEVPTAYSFRINIEFIKSALRGISLLFASGDSGSAGDDGKCTDDKFVPMWPAGSPFVTAVGGTTGSSMPESAWSGSSGGFSNIYPSPLYQQDAVATFFDNAADAGTLPNTSWYDTSGRGFPDISAEATDYPVYCDGILLPSIGGTSCASPTSGGIFGLLNDARLAAGKSSLGFLNPMLYANPDALTDCTTGTQGGCKINGESVDGFPAVEGWDPVTGLGSPNYKRLLAVVMELP